jgi:hypothetical protein
VNIGRNRDTAIESGGSGARSSLHVRGLRSLSPDPDFRVLASGARVPPAF